MPIKGPYGVRFMFWIYQDEQLKSSCNSSLTQATDSNSGTGGTGGTLFGENSVTCQDLPRSTQSPAEFELATAVLELLLFSLQLLALSLIRLCEGSFLRLLNSNIGGMRLRWHEA